MFKVGDSVRIKSGEFTGAYGLITFINDLAQTCDIENAILELKGINLDDIEAN